MAGRESSRVNPEAPFIEGRSLAWLRIGRIELSDGPKRAGPVAVCRLSGMWYLAREHTTNREPKSSLRDRRRRS